MTQHRIIVMGVSGCGKTTIGDLVARELGVPFLDGDSLHPVENVAKMAAGTPLTDEDRWPWLATVGSELAKAGDGGLVLACSALRRRYRDAIRAQAPDTIFLHLHGTQEVLKARIEGRLPARSGRPGAGRSKDRRREGDHPWLSHGCGSEG